MLLWTFKNLVVITFLIRKSKFCLINLLDLLTIYYGFTTHEFFCWHLFIFSICFTLWEKIVCLLQIIANSFISFVCLKISYLVFRKKSPYSYFWDFIPFIVLLKVSSALICLFHQRRKNENKNNYSLCFTNREIMVLYKGSFLFSLLLTSCPPSLRKTRTGQS